MISAYNFYAGVKLDDGLAGEVDLDLDLDLDLDFDLEFDLFLFGVDGDFDLWRFGVDGALGLHFWLFYPIEVAQNSLVQ